MTTLLEQTSTITAKGQTTVPKAVRDALGLHQGDRIAFSIDERAHRVTLHRAEDLQDDPLFDAFLAFLSKDLEAHPEKLQAIGPALVERIAELTAGVDVDPDQPIEGDVSL